MLGLGSGGQANNYIIIYLSVLYYRYMRGFFGAQDCMGKGAKSRYWADLEAFFLVKCE